MFVLSYRMESLEGKSRYRLKAMSQLAVKSKINRSFRFTQHATFATIYFNEEFVNSLLSSKQNFCFPLFQNFNLLLEKDQFLKYFKITKLLLSLTSAIKNYYIRINVRQLCNWQVFVIIKFGYNVRCPWLKERALSESRS